jgi:uncharacterized membrane protein YhaH (DUF805 family)
MTSPAEQWFSLSIRRERKSFIFGSIILLLLMVAIIYVIDILDVSNRVKTLFLAVYAALATVVSYTLSAQRLRDMGVTGWLALIWLPINFSADEFRSVLTSIFILILWVVPGTQGSNRYGRSPIAHKIPNDDRENID